MNTVKNFLFAAGTVLFSGAQAQEVISQDFYDNGKLQNTWFSDGAVLHFMSYYESGRLQEVGAFRNGQRDGVWKQFAENGALLVKAEFAHGIRQGTWEFRDPANVLKVRLDYKQGSLAHGEQYNESGEVIAQRTY